MENLLEVCLEAHHPAANHHRRYEVCVGKDLFGDWTLIVRYGRTGQRGQEIRRGSPNAALLQALIRKHLRRRLSAPKRIGCHYQLTKLSSIEHAFVRAWLPSDVLGQFRASVSLEMIE